MFVVSFAIYNAGVAGRDRPGLAAVEPVAGTSWPGEQVRKVAVQ